MNEHDAILSEGSMSVLKELRKALAGSGLDSSISGPPGCNPNR